MISLHVLSEDEFLLVLEGLKKIRDNQQTSTDKRTQASILYDRLVDDRNLQVKWEEAVRVGEV